MRLSPPKAPDYRWRFWVTIGILGLLVIGLLSRIIYLNVIDRPFLQQQGNERALRTVTIPSYRGIISDRNGQPLAISTPVYAVWADPKIFSATPAEIAALAQLIGIPATNITETIAKNSKRQFIYLQRDLDPSLGTQIKALNIKGIYLDQQFRRYYPDGPIIAQVIGFTNIDDQGQEGLELQFNQWLQGASGLKQELVDRFGNIISNIAILKQPVAGRNLVLSIDNRIQYIAYHELLQGVQNYGAASGSIIVMDLKTGEILAMANVPSYNPNQRPTGESSSYRNRAVTDTFEPGSTMKAFAMTAALSSGQYNLDSTVDTSPGYYFLDGKKVDDDGHNNGIISLTQILQVSSNVGMSKVVLSLAPNALPDMIRQVGFDKITGSGFPGESPGYLPNPFVWPKFGLATLSFGYGVSVTLIQLIHAYSIIANNGVEIPITFLRTDQAPEGKQVIKPQVAHDILTMLQSVLEQGGTAVDANVPGYHIAGKTGTTRILGPHGYELDHHNAMFVGIAPATNPRLIIAIQVHDPEKKAYYGGFVAGPIFSHVMESALRLLNVPPDDPSTLPTNTTTATQ